MRQLSRASRSIELWSDVAPALPSNRYLCAACRARHVGRPRQSSFSTSASRHAAIPFTEKIRRKIWGTDNPPGAADPYTESLLFPRDGKAARRQDTDEGGERKVTRPPKRQQTAVPDDPSYVPATTWDGLEHVGGQGGWWKTHWDPEHQYEGFMPSDRLETPQDLAAALRRAVIEVYTFHQAPDKSLSDLGSEWDSEDFTRDVQIAPSPDGKTVKLIFPDEETHVHILSENLMDQPASMVEEDEIQETVKDNAEGVEILSEEVARAQDQAQAEDSAVESQDIDINSVDVVALQQARQTQLQELAEQIASWDPAWLSIPLTSPEIKFAVTKRILRLSGHRITDPTINNLVDASSLLSQLIKPPKPKKLADALVTNEMLQSLPNVKIHGRRVTPIDRQKAVGRWKVIEKELERRGLPVTGSG